MKKELQADKPTTTTTTTTTPLSKKPWAVGTRFWFKSGSSKLECVVDKAIWNCKNEEYAYKAFCALGAYFLEVHDRDFMPGGRCEVINEIS